MSCYSTRRGPSTAKCKCTPHSDRSGAAANTKIDPVGSWICCAPATPALISQNGSVRDETALSALNPSQRQKGVNRWAERSVGARIGG